MTDFEFIKFLCCMLSTFLWLVVKGLVDAATTQKCKEMWLLQKNIVTTKIAVECGI